MTASPATIETLPALVLDLICEYLAAGESSRRSIFAFSLASKRCCGAATAELFKSIHLKVEGPKPLMRNLARWKKLVEVNGRIRYVRRMKITGSVKPHRENSWDDWRLGWWNSIDESLDSDDDTISHPSCLRSVIGPDPAIDSKISKARRNLKWVPLVDFLSTCLGLKDFIWESTDQVPRPILDVLHNKLPKCRLHVNTFNLRSLYQNRGNFQDIDPDEYVLASSPSLHSICTGRTGDDITIVDYNQDAILEMVTGVAPNLQSVSVWTDCPFIEESSPRPPWPGLPGNTKIGDTYRQGRLTRLSLHVGFLTLRELDMWARHVDFTKLQCLELAATLLPKVLQALISIAEMGVFRCLRKLSLFGAVERREELLKFLSRLVPLESLTLSGVASEAMLSKILNLCGDSLRELGIVSGRLITAADLQHLVKACGNIRKLKLHVRRSHGDRNEVELYSLLGTLPHLERLHLLLDCAPQGSEAEPRLCQQEEVERMVKALRNSAIDARLAEEIFHTVLASNLAIHPDTIAPFRSLKITSSNYEEFQVPFQLLLQWVGANWKCERVTLDAHDRRVYVREIGATFRTPSTLENFQEVLSLTMSTVGDSLAEDSENDNWNLSKLAWGLVWPQAKGKWDWFEKWHSFPLSSDSEIVE